MSRGFPLVVHGMPNFLRHEAVSICGDSDEFVQAIMTRRSAFDLIQGALAKLVEDNQPSSRYSMLMNIIGEK